MSIQLNESDKILQALLNTSQRLYNIHLQQLYMQRTKAHPNPFVSFGAKVFSQSDEDGLTFEIVRRLGILTGTFLEFGVGKGTENNTLALAASGWRGEWFGGETLAFTMPTNSKVKFNEVWISRENILGLIHDALQRLEVKDPDLLSIDLDGNDLFLIKEILSAGYRPRVWICEYNGKFIPPIEFTIAYSATHRWSRSDYFGASLTTISKAFEVHGYRPVCCNAHTGANVFFIQDQDFPLFPEVPENLESIYATPNYNLLNFHGHQASVETILACLRMP